MGTRVIGLARSGFREQRRRPLLLVLLAVVPWLFITRAISITEPIPRIIALPAGASVLTDMRAIHGAVMAAITVGFLVGLCGVFMMESAKEADRRLVVAGVRPAEVVSARLAVLVAAATLVVAVSLLVTGLSFTPRSWTWFAIAVGLVGLEYGAVGAIGGALLGKLGATYALLFLSMLDLGVYQDPMFGTGTPAGWTQALPGYGPMRVAIDAAFAANFQAWTELTVALAWVTGLVVVATVVLARSLRSSA